MPFLLQYHPKVAAAPDASQFSPCYDPTTEIRLSTNLVNSLLSNPYLAIHPLNILLQ